MIVKLEDLTQIRQKHETERIILTSGTFDLLHVGHLRYLDAIKTLGDVVIVLLSSDGRVKARKGPKRPIIPEKERACMLDALKIVDYVLIDPAQSPPDQTDPVHVQIVRDLNPDIYATDGEDPRFFTIMDESKLKVLPRTDETVSTSAIIERINHG